MDRSSVCYENYAKLRDSNYLTDYAVGKRAGINRGCFTTWRNGANKPSRRSLEKLAVFFGVSVNYFYEE